MNDSVAVTAEHAVNHLLVGDWDWAEETVRRLPPDDLPVLYSMLQDLSSITAHLIIERGGLPHPPKD